MNKFASLISSLLVFLAADAQRLSQPYIRLDGRVEIEIQARPRLDPHMPVFASDYDEETIVFDCHDSLMSTFDFSSPQYGTAHEESVEELCTDHYDLHYPYFFRSMEWMNTCDLLPLIRLQNGFMFWGNWESDTLHLTGSDHVYICGNDQTGHWETEDQYWILNANGQVSEVIQFRPDKSVMARHLLSYTQGEKIRSISGYYFNAYDSSYVETQTREWHYDSLGRDRLVIAYPGLPGKFTEARLSSFEEFLSKNSIHGSSAESAYLDSCGVSELVVYRNDAFGPTAVHGFYNSSLYSLEEKFYCDSIYYDAVGRIIRYVGSKNGDGGWMDFNYFYNDDTHRVFRTEGKEHTGCGDRGCTDGHVFQEFSYNKGDIETMQQITYKRHYLNNDKGEFSTREILEEERVYSYLLKRSEQ